MIAAMVTEALERLERGEHEPTHDQSFEAGRVAFGVSGQSFDRNFRRLGKPKPRPPVSGSTNFFCSRQVAYSLRGTPSEPPDALSRNRFYMGDCAEALILGKMILAGLPVLPPANDGQHEVDAMMDGDEIRGHVDVLLDLGAEGIYWKAPGEIKSYSEYGYDLFVKNGPGNTFGYEDQLTFYEHAVGSGRGFFVGVNKSSGKWHVHDHKYDPKNWERMEASYAHAKQSTYRTPPARPPWAEEAVIQGNKNKPWTKQLKNVRCSFCKYRPTCWPDHKPVIVSKKVKYRRPMLDAEVEDHKTARRAQRKAK